jgi:SAM-dependent methyltransferase
VTGTSQDDRERAGAARHWDGVYRVGGPAGVSWFEPEPSVSLSLVELLAPDRSTAVIDVGGGASLLVDRLVAAGYGDVSVLDISAVALGAARRRLGAGSAVHWIEADVLEWSPARRYGLWHDRAVFHFLTAEAERALYLRRLSQSLVPGGTVVVGTFAADGPDRCSGLPVARYGADELCAVLGPSFRPAARRRALHVTPAGAVQAFTWVAGTMGDAGEPDGPP